MQGDRMDIESEPRRSWRRFSLRGLFVLTALVAIVLARWRWQLQLEREIEQVVSKYQGEVSYWDESPTPAHSHFAKWHAAMFGESTLWQRMMVEVSLENMPRTERKDFIRMLGRRRGLKTACLYEVDDDTLEAIGESLTDVESLVVSGLGINDSGLAHLATLEELELLALIHTSVTGTGFEHLRNATKLHSLIVQDSQLSDAGLAHFPTLPQLKQVGLMRNHLTNEAFYSMCRVKSIEQLTINDSIIPEEDVARVTKSLPNLRALNSIPINRSKLPVQLPATFQSTQPSASP